MRVRNYCVFLIIPYLMCQHGHGTAGAHSSRHGRHGGTIGRLGGGRSTHGHASTGIGHGLHSRASAISGPAGLDSAMRGDPSAAYSPLGRGAAAANARSAADRATLSGLNSGGMGHAMHGADPIAAASAAMAMEQAMYSGMSPTSAAAMMQAQANMRAEAEANAIRSQMEGDVFGGGFSGVNMGGANDPSAAKSNVFHSPMSAALHEAGPFGSQSALAANMMGSDDPTIRQRLAESRDTVHDDSLKANLATAQRLGNEIRNKVQKSYEAMEENLKMDAANAARRDQLAEEMQANNIMAQAPGGDLEAMIPGQNMTYRQAAEKHMQNAEHAAAHARNPDLYEMENAAEKAGYPRPTIGQEVMEQSMRNAIAEREKALQEARAAEMAQEEERRMAAEAMQEQLANEQAARDAEQRAAEAKQAHEGEVIQAAEANEAYQRAEEAERMANLEAGEAAAASAPTVGEIKRQAANMIMANAAANAAGEAAIIKAADQGAAEGALAAEAAKQAIAAEEANVASVGDKAAAAKEMAKAAAALNEQAQARADLANQKLGEAAAAQVSAAEIGAAVAANQAAITVAGEAAVAEVAQKRGAELAAAAQEQQDLAMLVRAKSEGMAVAAAQQKAIAMEAREKGILLSEQANAYQTALEEAQAKQRALAQAAAKEASIAAAVQDATEAITQEALKGDEQKVQDQVAEEKAEKAGFNKDDAYQILGTIPDDADTVSIKNSSLSFPLKAFKAVQAHNQAEAGALAAQNKIRDDIRGKVTAEKFDSPLNVLEGEGGFLNIPENAQRIDVESGRAYFSDAAVANMEKEGLDISALEHKVNTGERSDMGIGLTYYVADVSGMELDVPSPTNPDPPRVLTGHGKTLDISQAQGMDIQSGELKLEKWQEYSRRVRPQVNTEIVSNGRDGIIEAVIDDDCVKQALRDADAMYKTKSEIITNPNGESYISVTPPYGVTEQIPYDEAVFNLDRIKEACGISHGQMGVSMMQQSDLKGAEAGRVAGIAASRKNKSLNIAAGAEAGMAASEEEELTKNALQMASGELETHGIIKHANAFDNQVHGEKSAIISEGADAIAAETGMTAEEVEARGSLAARLDEEAKEASEAMHEATMQKINVAKEEGQAGYMETAEGFVAGEEAEFAMTQNEIAIAKEVKSNIEASAASFATQMGITTEEFENIISKVSYQDLAEVHFYFAHTQTEGGMAAFEKAKSDFKLLFGTHAEMFTNILFSTISKVTGLPDPNEQIIIKKETHYVPKIVKTVKQGNKYGGQSTIVESQMMPVTKIIKIPIKRIIHMENGQTLAGMSGGAASGMSVSLGGIHLASSGAMNSASSKISQQQSSHQMVSMSGQSSSSYLNAHGISTQDEKIKLGDNAIIMGTTQDINNLVDKNSIGNITEVRKPGDTPKNGKVLNTHVPQHSSSDPFSTTSQEITIKEVNPAECKDCVNPKPGQKPFKDVPQQGMQTDGYKTNATPDDLSIGKLLSGK